MRNQLLCVTLLVAFGFMAIAGGAVADTSKSCPASGAKGRSSFPPASRSPDTLLFEGFEAGIWPPAGWDTLINKPDSTWALDNGWYVHSGSWGAVCQYIYGTGHDEWLISPPVDLGFVLGAELSFWWQSSYYWMVDPNDHFDVFVLGTIDSFATFDTLWISGEIGVFNDWEWYNTTFGTPIDLGAYLGQSNFQFAFRYVGFDDADFGLDDILVDGVLDQIPPQVTVVVPNGGEDWAVGEEDTIRWIASDNVGVDHLDIFYSIDAGANWDTVATGEPNDSSYAWTVPPTPSESCLVRVIAYDASLLFGEDESDSVFTISDQSPPQVTVLVPNGGEQWAVGDTVTIEWIATDNIGVDSLSIHYSTDGGSSWDTVSTGELNDSAYAWDVPPSPSPYCLVKIEAFDGEPNVGSDESDSLFTIYAPGVDELVADGLHLPKFYSLAQSHPNPARVNTTIRYQLPRRSEVVLRVYDTTGSLVRELVGEKQKPGYYTITWDGKDPSGRQVASGAYFCRLTACPEPGRGAGSFEATKKLVLLR